jgi:hypothetical protein
VQKTLNILSVVVVLVLLLSLAVVSTLGMIDPHKASIGFGMPTTDASADLFYRVYVSRNLALVAIGLVFLAMRLWLPLAVTMTCATPLAAFDMSVLALQGKTPPAFHAGALVLLIISIVLLWRRVVMDRA